MGPNPSEIWSPATIFEDMSGKEKDTIYCHELFFLVSAYLLSTVVTFLPEVFGERGVCFKPTYQCSFYVVLWPLPTAPRIVLGPCSFPYWPVPRLLESSANWLFQRVRGGEAVEETIISLLLYKRLNFTGFFFFKKEEKFQFSTKQFEICKFP